MTKQKRSQLFVCIQYNLSWVFIFLFRLKIACTIKWSKLKNTKKGDRWMCITWFWCWLRIYYIRKRKRKKLTNRAAKQKNREDEQLHFWTIFILSKNGATRHFSCQSFRIDQSENCSCTCFLFVFFRTVVYEKDESPGTKHDHQWGLAVGFFFIITGKFRARWLDHFY